MKLVKKEYLLLSSLRVLLFNILSSVRFIFVESIDNKLILSIYTDKDLTKDEKDIYYSVSGEISGDFPILNDSASEVQFKVDNSEFELINNSGYLVYARYEEVKMNSKHILEQG